MPDTDSLVKEARAIDSTPTSPSSRSAYVWAIGAGLLLALLILTNMNC